MRLNLLLLFFATLVSGFLQAQDTNSIMEYIDSYKDLAMAEMKRTGVPASVKLAQGIHETSAGTSPLVMKSNNHFGIKCKTGWNGPSVKHDDDARNECFRKYESATESYQDHSNFLKGSARYAPLFKLDPADYEGWAWGLKKAGYATNPKYAQTLIKLIEDYGLQEYTLIAMGKKSMYLEETEEPAPETPTVETVVKSEEIVRAESVAKKTEGVKTETGVEKSATVAPTSEKVGTLQEEVGATKQPVKEERYPSGIFQQNGRRAIFVRAGTPYLAIAQQGKLPLQKLFEYNDLTPAVEASNDQLVYLEKKARTAGGLLSLSNKSR